MLNILAMTCPCMLTGAGNPLPSIIHATLTSQQLGAGRIVIVGDVHGCLAELRELLAECDFRMGADTLIFVGDLVNKGPLSAEVGGRQKRLDPIYHSHRPVSTTSQGYQGCPLAPAVTVHAKYQASAYVAQSIVNSLLLCRW